MGKGSHCIFDSKTMHSMRWKGVWIPDHLVGGRGGGRGYRKSRFLVPAIWMRQDPGIWFSVQGTTQKILMQMIFGAAFGKH